MADLAVQTPGPRLAWERTYHSQVIDLFSTNLSQRWRHTYESKIIPANQAVEVNTTIIVSPDGNELRFEDLANDQFRPYPGVYATLTRSGDVFTYTTRDQQQYLYDANSGRLTATIDASGRRVNIQRNADDQLSAIVDANDSSRRLTFVYDTDGMLSQVSDGTRTVRYEYELQNGDGRLARAFDVMGRKTSYTYHATSGLLHEIRNPLNELVERVVYDTQQPPRVSQQTLHDGSQKT
ncbi:hypothetical protein HC891_20200, partial [Candidatus Gracilibacteria bacterium]|nr:hypothetical protein [Candidatus Gracilibacteria bacterium]